MEASRRPGLTRARGLGFIVQMAVARTARAHAWPIAAAVALIFAAAGCGKSSDADEKDEPVVPGGATLTTSGSAPKVCSHLTEANEVRALGSAITGWAQQPSATAATGQLRAAATKLDELARDAGEISPALTAAARALTRAADSPPARRAVRRLATAMQRFGRQLEKPCGYPLG
jgi:hypothetical protein